MTNPDNVGGLPELPEPAHHIKDRRFACKHKAVYTADQMRAYGGLCRAAPAGGDGYEARYATPERLAKPAATVKCDFCGVRPGELHAYDCTALDSAPAGGDGWPFLEEIGRDGKPTGYWIRKGSPAAARMSAPAGSGEVGELIDRLETEARLLVGCIGRSDQSSDVRALRDAAALLRKL